jgi:hypothetical protein
MLTESFQASIGGTVSPLSGTTTSTPWRVAEIVGAFDTLEEALQNPRVIITWLEANTASLVGPRAAAALSEFLQEHEAEKGVSKFLNEALAWRITQDLGPQHNPDAALNAWRTNLELARRHQRPPSESSQTPAIHLRKEDIAKKGAPADQ